MNHLRRILPYLPEIGPASFRATLVDMFPHDGVQEVKRFIDTMYRRSVEIYRGKLRALELGDEAVTKQVGEGNDIMSILSTCLTSILPPTAKYSTGSPGKHGCGRPRQASRRGSHRTGISDLIFVLGN